MPARNYEPIVKTLTDAKPTIRKDDNIVTEWNVEVSFEYAGDDADNLPAWSTNYNEIVDVSELEKTVAEFTKQELIGFIPEMYEERIFHDHYESFVLNAKPETQTDSDFSIEQLS